MKVLEWVVIGLVAYTVIYMILKAIEFNHKYRMTQQPVSKPVQKPTPKQIEIRSRDLYCRAENLIATHEVYGLQVEQITHQINEVELALETERASCIKSDSEIKSLIAKSLRLQEQKCRLESKMLKICKELDDIAKEEYKRQTR